MGATELTYRSLKWRKNVASLDACVRCGSWGVQAAHRDQGKGMGIKTSDALTAALCPSCHTELGEGKNLSRAERRAEMDSCIILTLERLADRGLVKPT